MVHTFCIDSTYLAVDVNSGAVHVLDELAYKTLRCLDEAGENIDEPALLDLKLSFGQTEVDEALLEIKQLKSSGLLFSVDNYANRQDEWNGATVVKALCLHISHECNLRCRYCFADKDEYLGNRTLMSEAVGIKSLDFLVANSGNRKNLEIDFFGGEPLMNLEVVKKIVAYGRSIEQQSAKKFRFTLTTNGMLLDDDNMNWANSEMDNIVLSIDGRPEVNDRMRRRMDGSGSYNRILPRIQEMVKKRGGKSCYVRGTFTRENLDFSKDVLHLAELGFDRISVEPVVASADSGLDIRQEDLAQISLEYELLAKAYLKAKRDGRAFTFFHFMLDLEGGPCVAKRLRGCGAGTEYAAVTPEGELYPCHQFVGNKEFCLGNVESGFVRNPFQELFAEATVYSKPDCNACWSKFYCSGGCAANAWKFNADIKKPYAIGCELEKKRVECALWLKAMEMEV